MLMTPVAVAGTLRIGVIANPRSHAYDRHAAEIAGCQDVELLRETPASPAALAEALARFHRENVGLIVLVGGDGTLRDVLTALPAACPGTPPSLALLPTGNTNLAARALGTQARGQTPLADLLAAAMSGRLRRTACPVLDIRWKGQPERPALRGLFFGAAGFAEAKRLADSQIHRRGLHRGHAIGFTLALAFLRTLLGGGVFRQGATMSFGADTATPVEGCHFLVLATTLDRLTLGLWPFWGEGDGAIRWLDIMSPPQRLAAALVAILRRRQPSWLGAAGYRSGRASQIELSLTEPFVLDGEFFDPGPSGITVSAPGAVDFLHL